MLIYSMTEKHETETGLDRARSQTSAYQKERPSDRMFRRSRRAEMRRRKAAKEDAVFFRVVYSLAGVATAFVFVLIFMASSGGGVSLASLTPLAQPWLGPVSKLEAFGFGTIGFLALFYLVRLRKK